MDEKAISDKLSQIWGDYNNRLGEEVQQVLNRNYVFACPQKKDILVTGLNPAFDVVKDSKDSIEPRCYCFSSPTFEKNKYYKPIEKQLGVNRVNAEYLDVLYYRDSNAKFWMTISKAGSIKGKADKPGLSFLAEQVRLTQSIVEEISPKLIIVRSKESCFLWGKDACKNRKGQWNKVWMGYTFQKLDLSGIHFGEVCRITGLLDSSERVSPDIKQTNLKGTIVYFYMDDRYKEKEKKLTPELVEMLYQLAK